MPPPSKPSAVIDLEAEDTMMDEATKVLQSTFKLQKFHPMQEKVIRRLLVDNASAALILPTGGGKSLTYQLPSLLLKDGLTIVVSPLLALTKDQIDSLKRHGIRAEALDSTLSLSEAQEVRNKVRSNSLDILYVTPERLNNASFINLLQSCRSNNLSVDLIAVDEAHCVSEWGHSFRPCYLKVARFVREVGAKRVLALTATATEKVVQDICVQFDIDYENGAFRASSYRENLHLNAITTPSEISKRKELNRLLGGGTMGDTIVYTTTQENTEEVAREMREDGHDAKHYHAGMNNFERKAIQDWFVGKGDTTSNFGDEEVEKENRIPDGDKKKQAKPKVVVATIAFGMGIDKRDIRNVVHYKLPKTLESYSQEIGRAGRNGLTSTCTMFLSSKDTPTIEGFIRGDTPTLPSLERFMDLIFAEKGAGKEIGEDIEISLYQTAKECDIKDGVLKLIFTYLELEHGFIRATTPRYKTYQMQFQTGGKAGVKRDKSELAGIIGAAMKEGVTWTTLEIDNVAAPYSHIIAKLGEWENAHYIQLKSSNVFNVFILIKDLPDAKLRKSIALQLYDRLHQKEIDDLDRLKGVINYGTHEGCLAAHLAAYFGDKLPDGKDKCGNCSFCTTGKAAKPIKNTVGGGIGDEEDGEKEDVKMVIQPVLKACGVRDDPMLLARLAFGIASPRISALKMTKSDVYGSLDRCDFEELLGCFKEECEKVGFVNVEGWDDEMVGKKKETAPKNYSGGTPSSSGSGYASKGKSGGGSYGSYGAGSKRKGYSSGSSSFNSSGSSSSYGRGGGKFARRKY